MLSLKMKWGLVLLVLSMLVVVGNVFVVTSEEMKDVAKEPELSGLWRVTMYAKDMVMVNKTLAFQGDTVVYHPSDEDEDVTSRYEINDDYLALTDIGKTFQMVFRTEHFIELIEVDNGPHWLILKMSDDIALKQEQVDYTGEWKVLLHGNTLVEERFVLQDNEITFYKQGSDEPFFVGSYEWVDTNVMYLDALKLKLCFYRLNEECATMWETETGYVWEIQRAE